MAQLVALMSSVVLGGVADVVGSNLTRGKIFTASIGSVDSLYPSVYILCLLYGRSDLKMGKRVLSILKPSFMSLSQILGLMV